MGEKSGKIILNLAMSIDGFISDDSGGFEWIKGQGDKGVDTEEKFDFADFLSGIDIVVMGKNCYDQGFANDYSNKTVCVVTSKDLPDTDSVKHVKPNDVVHYIKKQKSLGKSVFLFGGGVTIDPFIKANAIDEYIVGVIPVLLGRGRRLFFENNPTIKLSLKQYTVDDGVIILKYTKR